jgi:hypothetical protein
MAQNVFGFLAFLGYIAGAVCLILEPETVGQATGYLGHGHVGAPTPSWLVRFAGSSLLAVIPGVLLAGLTGLWWLGVLGGTVVAVVLYRLVARWRPLDDRESS